MRTVKEALQGGERDLKRLTAAMNGREFDGSVAVEAATPYSTDFTRALLDYCFGDASEAETLRAMQIDDPAVLPVFAGQLERAAQKAGMDEAALIGLQTRLSQSEASASAT